MTKNILICNQRGGVDKSTPADMPLWSFGKDGIPASFYNLENLKIPQSELVVQVTTVGKSVIDYVPKSSTAEAASEFVQYIRSIIQI